MHPVERVFIIMEVPIGAAELLEREYLGIRAKILEIAATFDRIDRSRGDLVASREMPLIRQALEVLLSEKENATRAEQIQLIFSRPYDDQWTSTLEMPSR
ncbi:MAG TPA: hypothetical protein QF761_13305 [Pirellulales bacterium]|nr:hypothetical protein [Pirellulales bacterium]|tara:strand:+ start:22 stop:321 length:300 start_codon:yes stop_codon:yes gene_type:complete